MGGIEQEAAEEGNDGKPYPYDLLRWILGVRYKVFLIFFVMPKHMKYGDKGPDPCLA